MRLVLAVLAGLGFATPSVADEITIPLPDGVAVERTQGSYSCDGRMVDVEYINAGTVSLAVLRFDGELVVASNVVSGSGARYAGGRYVWWSKGDEALLIDEMAGDDAEPVRCEADTLSRG